MRRAAIPSGLARSAARRRSRRSAAATSIRWASPAPRSSMRPAPLSTSMRWSPTPAAPRHRIFALSLKDGAPLPGWPIDVADVLRTKSESFDSRVQNQRGALTILNGILYIPYGGFYGDCGDYHGWVVGVPLGDPQRVAAWRTRGRGGGIWAPGGIASDGISLYVATGNPVGARDWADGEAVFRLAPDLHHSERNPDFFAASDWRALDTRDADLGGTNPLPLDLPGGPPVVLALGKDEKAYLLDRSNLGGFCGCLVTERVSTFPIPTPPAPHPPADATLVAPHGPGAPFLSRHGGDLTVFWVAATPRPAHPA